MSSKKKIFNILSWILLIVIVFVVFAYFAPSPPSKLPRRCVFTQGITCIDNVISQTSGTLQISINNGLGNNITLTGLYFNSTDVSCEWSDVRVDVNYQETGMIESGRCINLPGINSPVKGTMILAYRDKRTGFEHNITGSLFTYIRKN